MFSIKTAPGEARASIANLRRTLRRVSNLTGLMAAVSGLVLFTACDTEQIVEPVVEPPPAFAIEATAYAVSPTSQTISVGQYFRFRAIRTDGSGSSVSVTWSTPNTSVIRTYSDGYVKGLANGTATLTAYNSTYGTATATVTVGTGGTTATTGTTTTTTTTTSPVLTTVAVTPATVSVSPGATTQLTAVGKDQNGNAMSGVTFTWTSANGAVATVSSSGLVTGVAAGQVAVAATSGGKTASAMVTVGSAGTTATSGSAAPPSTGIWIGKTELNAIAMGSNGWSGTGELKATADAAWTPQIIELQSNQVFNVQVMAGALVFARLYPDPSAETYRKKVAQALRQAIALPDSTAASVTAPSRNLGAFAIAADLINLRSYDPALDTQFRAWLTRKLDVQYQSGSPSIRLAAWNRPNNIGAYSRFSLAAAAAYLGDRATLDRLALVMRRWLGNTSVNHSFKWYDVSYTWQVNPSNSATWVGVNPKGATRDGNNFDGLQPEEQERGTPTSYSSTSFPNDHSSVRYNEVALEAHLATVLILHRAGYTDLMDASDQAMLRAAKWIKYAADNFSAKGYRYFTDSREAARPLINYFYRSAGLPEARTRNQMSGRAFGFTWTYWTHGGRSIR